jgi:threonine/homoserine/homoserine lactone efflux protein
VVSIVYLLWLAWRLATARAADNGPGGGGGQPMSFMQAAMFQWVNPKAWVFALSVCGAYLDPQRFRVSFVTILLVCWLVSVPCVALWAGFGSALSRILAHPLWLRVFNLAMAGLLVLSLTPIIMDVLRYTRLTTGAL